MNPFVVKPEPLLVEIAEQQVTHPVHLYQPGSPLLERLYERMTEANRFTWPADVYSGEV